MSKFVVFLASGYINFYTLLFSSFGVKGGDHISSHSPSKTFKSVLKYELHEKYYLRRLNNSFGQKKRK